ncbi:hypothetical protein BT96DRAFT_1018860 [Gymnopus androsaceus JB14]|uniref:Uncharacterized protein n=1 Tax=Gymnopus androsaceus JB14 TaxID=1447944 RepID=A0A6A4HU69_9AGAR|nr:hypothetical protein BT96DRAFT_1018860 [Gymnopus androsaceus JB14]
MHFCSNCKENLFSPRIDVDLSSIREKLRSESGPASVQPDEVADILQNVQRDLEDYESEIHRIESRRIFLDAQRKRLQIYASHVESLVAPIRKIPTEILQRIFDDCCDTNHFKVMAVDSPSQTLGTLVDKPALVLSSVCSRWRMVGLSSSSIWSRISLEYNACIHENDVHLYNQLSEILATFVKRSQEWLLDLTVTFDADGIPPEFRPFSILAAECRRWYTLTMRSIWRANHLFSGAISLADLSFPKLVKLELQIADDLEFFISRTPNLQILNLETFPALSPGISLEGLSCLKVNVDDHDMQANILAQPTSISSLDIKDLVADLTDLASIPPLMFSTMETLTIRHESEADSTCSIFPFFTCPSLKTLHLELTEDDECNYSSSWANFRLFMSFVQRSSFPLTILSIESLALSDSNLVHLLSYLPTLLDFTLDDTDVPYMDTPLTSRFIESLHSYQTSSLHQQTAPLVPRLRHLHLNVGAPSFKDDSVVDLVKSRWTRAGNEVDCLRSFTIIFRGRTKIPDAYSVLDHIEKDGLRLAVLWKMTGSHSLPV